MEETSRTTTIFLLILLSLQIQKTYNAEINIITDSSLLTKEDTLVSPAGVFELGFFRPDDGSDHMYLGIWYKNISIKTIVWVANRNIPLTGPSSRYLLKIADPGVLIVVNNITNDVIWSTNTTSSSKSNTIAELYDTGNLVVTDKKTIFWQSFDYPTDTILPGMKFGKDLLTEKEWSLSSWKSIQDPSPGEYTWSVDTRSYPQNLLKDGSVVKFRGGPWNGLRFSGASAIHRNQIYTYNVVINETEVIFIYNLYNNSPLTRLTLNPSGVLERLAWVEDEKKWKMIFELPKDICDSYNMCGAYGSCSVVNSTTCVCLDGTRFVPKDPKGWETDYWSGGCVRRRPLKCENGSDGFMKYSNVKLPDTHSCWFNRNMTLNECKMKCLMNCSCMAYSNMDIRGEGSGCLLWFNDLIDIRIYFDGNGGQDLFVRMASSELDLISGGLSVSRKKGGGANIKIILPVLFLVVLLVSLISSTWFWYTWRKRHHVPMEEGAMLPACESQNEAMELPLFSFSTISKATAGFSLNNKLGEGGFGPVYKGMLEEEGIEIAVKRLSTTSSQGLDEFKNEVICISKLQHRNLVKLLGCSIEGQEKLLIYEYMPNRSLDRFIFDEKQRTILDWTKRFDIIKGIARGLVYLHQDSRLRIIHRDLKASNILLDLDMNPKISDFGIARSFGGNETQANTERVVGTYGYMSPEYALDGVFSIKSDVFSFGVLTLEIVSGKRNRGFVHPEHQNNLIGHAWRMHNEGRPMDLIDTSLAESSDPSEVLRSIELGLLCVQQSPEDRPNMASVVMMLGGEGALPQPKQPAFFTERNLFGADFSTSTNPTSSTTGLTVTDLVAR